MRRYGYMVGAAFILLWASGVDILWFAQGGTRRSLHREVDSNYLDRRKEIDQTDDIRTKIELYHAANTEKAYLENGIENGFKNCPGTPQPNQSAVVMTMDLTGCPKGTAIWLAFGNRYQGAVWQVQVFRDGEPVSEPPDIQVMRPNDGFSIVAPFPDRGPNFFGWRGDVKYTFRGEGDSITLTRYSPAGQ